MPTSVNQDDCFVDLRTVIQSVISGPEVVRGDINRVSMPKEPFICMTEAPMLRLATNVDTYDGLNNQKTMNQAVQFAITVDCYGPLAGDWAAIITTVLRDEYATELMSKSQPLYCSDPLQMPLVDGEQQYETRFTFSAVLQYNPSVTVSQQYTQTVGPVAINLGDPA